MGYTYGRKRNIELLQVEALKYKTRSEFAESDRSLYAYAAKNNLLDVVCSHMKKIRGGFSIPQYICKIIFDTILEDNGQFNTRKVITPHEIDVYYPEFKLAIEYNGRAWHTERISPVKEDKLKMKGINLIVIEQGKCPSFFQDYIVHIKKDIIEKLDDINKFCNKHILPQNVIDVHIDFHDIPFNIDWGKIENFVKTCKSKSDLYQKNDYYYRLILKFDKKEMLEYLENKQKEYSFSKLQSKINEKLLYIKNHCTTYKDVTHDSKLYDFIKRHKLIVYVKNMFKM